VAYATASGITMIRRPLETARRVSDGRRFSSTIPSVWIVNADNGLYEAKQEAQCGKLAMFRRERGFLKFPRLIKNE
jgi:hypothetical protein